MTKTDHEQRAEALRTRYDGHICTGCIHYRPYSDREVDTDPQGWCEHEQEDVVIVEGCYAFTGKDDRAVSRARSGDDTQNRQVGGDHYVRHTIQPWDAMREWMSPEAFQGYLRGNAIKYIARCNDKGGVEDIDKAIHYLQQLAQEMRAC